MDEYELIMNECKATGYELEEVEVFRFAISLLVASKDKFDEITDYYERYKALRDGFIMLNLYNKFVSYCESIYGKYYYHNQRCLYIEDEEEFFYQLKNMISDRWKGHYLQYGIKHSKSIEEILDCGNNGED